MKVLFIYYDTASSEPPRIGFGVAYLSGYLKRRGHETRLCYFRSPEDLDYALSIIREWSPGMVAHSATSSSFFSVPEVARRVRAEHGNIFQICGGNHVSLLPEELEKTPELDAICIGYGEELLLELVEAIEGGNDFSDIKNLHLRRGGDVVKNPTREFPTDLDSFIPCDREIFFEEFKRFEMPPVPFGGELGVNIQEFIFCRGCPYDCTFCCNHALKTLGTGKYVRYPSVSKCIEELSLVKDETGMTGVAFHDDIFTLNKSWFREFSREYVKKVALPYVCNLRANCLSEDDVKLLKDSGCKFAILGVESGNEYIRNVVMKKNLKGEDIVVAYELLHEYGISTYSQNMIGLPEETPERFLDTVRINASIRPNSASLSVFFPYPGTVLYDRCVEEDLFDEAREDGSFRERKDTKLKLPNFPRDEIVFYVENFDLLIRYEYLSNKYKLMKKLFPLCLERQRAVVLFMSHCIRRFDSVFGFFRRKFKRVARREADG